MTMAKLIVDTNKTEWITRGDGVKQTTVHQEGGWVFSRIFIPPNTALAKHLHPENEYVYIVEGTLVENGTAYGQGIFLLNEKGSTHCTASGPDGCTILALWCGRIEYCGE